MKKFRVGYTQGTYDMFHIGHLNLLNHAKELCDILVVGVNSDALVCDYKHKHPVIGENERCEIVANVKAVDKAMVVHTLDKMELLKSIKFDVIFIGDDWKGNPRWESTEKSLFEVNIPTIYLPHGRKQYTDKNPGRFKIGYTTGCFDMFHIGHLNILRRAKEQCDFLIVGVSTDELIQSYKHKTPIIPFEERCGIVAACRYVDAVVPQTNRDKITAFEKYKFDVMFVGSDWKGNALFNEVEKYLNAHHAEVVYFPYTSHISSSILREKIGK